MPSRHRIHWLDRQCVQLNTSTSIGRLPKDARSSPNVVMMLTPQLTALTLPVYWKFIKVDRKIGILLAARNATS